MTHYEVFRECFPELKLTEEHYDKLAEEKLCRAFELPEGFALVKENELRLLCVLPQKRGNGAGTRLFRSAEDYIRSRGYERMEIGGALRRIPAGSSRRWAVPWTTALRKCPSVN